MRLLLHLAQGLAVLPAHLRRPRVYLHIIKLPVDHASHEAELLQQVAIEAAPTMLKRVAWVLTQQVGSGDVEKRPYRALVGGPREACRQEAIPKASKTSARSVSSSWHRSC